MVTNAQSFTHAHVLVVDDDPSAFRVITALLKQEGYSLDYAASGQYALDIMETVDPDVILLDLMMPDLDGLEVCRRVKSNPLWEHIPIIVVTALDSKEDLARSLEAGADDFITKPLDGLELRSRIRSMLRIKHHYDALQATLKLREDMANMVVHDLRNPVTAILLSSELVLAQEQPQGHILQRLETIQAAARNLNVRINELLMMAKLEASRMVLNRVEVDLCALATTVISDFQDLAHSKRIQIQTHWSLQENYWIRADASLVYRLLDNLLSNAIKFSPVESRVLVRIAPSCEPPKESLGEKWVQVQVIDEGLGIREDLKQQIFQPFETGEFVQETQQIGLGLAFCKQVAEAHGGTITVTDNHPRGAVFTVELPDGFDQAIAPEPAISRVAASENLQER
ncbi:MAG: hybrid sensor histidine kinase/response regulator [Synechococcales bacterium]|nr:hybrid sensor histidine kinase/response regulator [Synechococcales bacterium]